MGQLWTSFTQTTFAREVAGLSWHGWQATKQYARRWIIFWIIVLLTAACFVPWDMEVVKAVLIEDDRHPLHITAREISYWGDYPTGIAPTALLIMILASIFGGVRWRQVALAFLLGATVGGITSNVFRLTLCRPRPKTVMNHGVQDGLYFGRFHHDYQGFPSGHAATAFGTSGALMVTNPGTLGVPMTLAALAVDWSRMQTRNHYTSDLIVGSAIGLFWGMFFGMGANRFRREQLGLDTGQPNAPPTED